MSDDPAPYWNNCLLWWSDGTCDMKEMKDVSVNERCICEQSPDFLQGFWKVTVDAGQEPHSASRVPRWTSFNGNHNRYSACIKKNTFSNACLKERIHFFSFLSLAHVGRHFKVLHVTVTLQWWKYRDYLCWPSEYVTWLAYFDQVFLDHKVLICILVGQWVKVLA